MKTIAIQNIAEPSRTFRGRFIPARIYAGQHAEIVPGVSIRLYGMDTNQYDTPKAHNITFKVGDEAIFGSYNLIYTGKILAITAKTVTVQGHSNKPVRMMIAGFNDRNAHFDAAAIRERNNIAMQSI